MINQTASSSVAFVVGDQKVALPLCPDIKILTATFWNTNNGGTKAEILNPIFQFPNLKIFQIRYSKFQI